MKTTKNTILISGSSAGIGFEIAKLFSEKGNHVIITGRDEERLKKAEKLLQNVTTITCDISNEKDMDKLIERLKKDFTNLNILINNAGRAITYNLLDENANAYEKAKEEMQTNYFAIIRLTEKLLPQLKKQAESAIVNVSSIVGIVPSRMATYSASKAAMHSYTQSLRLQLKETSNIKVFELMPPLVNTDFSKEIGGANGIDPSIVAEEFFKALEKDEYEIHVGQAANLYKLYLLSPAEALKSLNNQINSINS